MLQARPQVISQSEFRRKYTSGGRPGLQHLGVSASIKGHHCGSFIRLWDSGIVYGIVDREMDSKVVVFDERTRNLEEAVEMVRAAADPMSFGQALGNSVGF